ncbi:hypothetical protein LK537_27475 [Lachnoclostridium pacaense]|uniref:hypothetical protein n=1 Tax=Enterocloster hominis (ex Hitch et al. 2024) TaxID=1917870 RepID=UPI001D10C3E9|nr:hypothetical protein [Lachnoclostridium pacaense]MCC2821041.1 hypothetical protein [Lachnoclostridium pacaense]
MKIKYSLLDKLNSLTNKEVDFILYVARYQDDYGCIRGMYYRDVCQNADMCKQTFYDTLRSLQAQGIITYSHVNQDYDITILDNDFSYPSAFHEGYINVSRQVFHTRRFHELKAKEKLLLLHFMKITHSGASGSYQIGIGKLYTKYMQLLGVTKRVLRGYLHSLKKFFAIGIKDGKYFISYLRTVFNDRVDTSETDQYMGHLVGVSCRRAKIKEIVPAAVKDVITIMKQYRKEAQENGAGKNIFDIVDECIKASVLGQAKKLNSKFVHKLVRSALGLNWTGQEVEF